ncbi:hypothetical protein E2C01_056195 [Portunus trituberculatus]|uniref:Uncharacterized protein n=1 Tax=Portunus trituberculatus TaxID=210409 RepID=A0A5B7GTG0_PORTR|nr:hypothetical protein [Portunus trituberculatus]
MPHSRRSDTGRSCAATTSSTMVFAAPVSTTTGHRRQSTSLSMTPVHPLHYCLTATSSSLISSVRLFQSGSLSSGISLTFTSESVIVHVYLATSLAKLYLKTPDTIVMTAARTNRDTSPKVLTHSFHSRDCNSLTLSDRPGQQRTGRHWHRDNIVHYKAVRGNTQGKSRDGEHTTVTRTAERKPRQAVGEVAPENQTVLMQENWVDAETGDRQAASK